MITTDVNESEKHDQINQNRQVTGCLGQVTRVKNDLWVTWFCLRIRLLTYFFFQKIDQVTGYLRDSLPMTQALTGTCTHAHITHITHPPRGDR